MDPAPAGAGDDADGTPPPEPALGMDDSQFLGSIIGLPAAQPPKRKRGRPPKRAGAVVAAAAPPRPPRRREDEEEVVCFICFDGGNLVVCDRRGCPKVYHPACIKRDEAFFQSRSKWNCGWHICSSCEKAVHYMCYTCTYSLCKVCIKQGKFFSVRGTKGFCDTCFGTILLIESKDESATKVDFDDVLSWEYLFKLYWLDLKGKLSLTLEELTSAKNRWNVPNTSARKEKEESSDDLYDVNNDDDAGSDCSSGKRRRTNSSKKKGRKRRKVQPDCSIAAKKAELPIRGAESVPMEVPNERVTLPVDTKVPNGQAPLPADTKVPNERVPLPPDIKWASPELLEFIGHMRDGDQSFISQFDVQTLLLEYIKKNNLRDPQRKSQIICDTRLLRLFRKARVAHFEMLKLLEMHFLTNETPGVNDSSQVTTNLNSAHVDTNGYSDMAAKLSPDKRRRMHRKVEREPQVNLEAYAAVDMHNINLIYVRRSVMEDLIDDATFSDKIRGAFVRIKISGVGQKQDIYRLVKVVGTHRVPEKYCIGKKMTNVALEILNLDKKEIITMDTTSNQDFTEEECKRLRQSMKCGVISRLKVGDIQEKAKILQSVRVNDWFENEKQRLGHLRDRASETGRRKELRECVEKLHLLNNSEERSRRINEVLEVHVDSHMDPAYESAEEMDDKKAVGRSVNWTRSDASIPRRKIKYPNTMHNHPQKVSDYSHHPKSLSTESTIRGLGGGRKFENSTYEAGLLSSPGVTMSNDMEPEKVWHYKDPSGNVQGPFTLLQLSKWTSYFPRDLRVWLTFESEERSLLLTEVLSKQQKDFTQAATLTSSKPTLAGTGHTMNSPSVDHTNALSPVGYSMVSSSGVPVHFNKYSVLERETVHSPDDSLSLSTSSVPPKDAHTVNSHAHCQTKHSVFIQSSGSSYGHTDLHHDRIQGGCSGESNHRHGSGALWSPTMAHTSCSGRGNVESHQNHHVSCSQCQHDSRDSSQGGSVKDLNSRRDLSKNLPTQRAGKDVSSPVFAWSPAESRTASSQHESSCLSSTNPSFLDELHSSIASAKPKSCAPATPIEDRGSSSPSGMLNHSERVPISSPHSAPYTSASDVCKMEEIMNQQRTHEVDTSNASVNQSPQSKIFPVSSPDIQDIGREFPSPTLRSENKDLAVDNLQLTPASPENAMTTYSHSSDTCKIVEIVSQQKTPEVVVSSPSDNHSPQSKVFPASSPNNKDQKHECPSSTPSSENTKVRDVDNLILTSADPENLTTPAPASDICKMEESMNHHHSPQSKVSPASSPNNKDQKHECPSSTPSSENTKVRDVDNLILTPVDPENLTTPAPASDICKMEESMNHQKTLEADTLDAPLYQPPHSSTPSNHDIDRECASPTPKSESKELLVDNSMTSATPESLMTTSASASDTCKIEEFVNQQKTLEVDASDAPLNQHPDPHIFPDNQDIESECASPTPRSDGKEPLVDNSVLTPAAPENLPTTLAPASDTSKMEILNKERTLQADASLNQPPPSTIDPSSSPYNQDIECGHPCPTPRSESEQPIVDNSGLTSIAPENLTSVSASASDISKMERTSNEKRTLEANASDASLNQPPHSSIFPSRDNQDVECAHPSPTPKSEGDQTLADDSGLRSIAPENLTSASASVSDICKMEVLNEKRILEADASDASLNQPPNSCIFPSDNQGVECEHPSPSPRSESEQPLADNSGLILIAPENSTSASASASDICKMEEILNEKTTLEANPSNGSDTPSPESKVFLVPSLDVLDIEHELSGTTHRPEVKEPVVDSSGLTSAAPENLTTKEPVRSQDAFVSPKSGLTGELDTMNADFKVEEIIQKELYYESEPTVVTRENMLIDLSCGAESIDVSDVLESLMEQRCGTSYMQGTMEGFLAASPEEEPQCSSPIALSPWGEPSYYQGDAVDSALWGVQDDPIIDMWSLLSPRPTLQSSSGIGTEGNGTYDIKVAAVAHGNTEIVQRGSVLWEENVNQTNLSAATDWTLHEQFPSISNDMLISSVDESTRVVGWQPSANQSLNGVTWSTGQNLNLSSNEKAEPSSKSSWEASRKQEATNSTVVEANGNTSKGLNPPSGNANRGSQRNPHHRGRYSQISESWLLSSNQSRSRSDRFGSGGSSRSTWKGQSRD